VTEDVRQLDAFHNPFNLGISMPATMIVTQQQLIAKNHAHQLSLVVGQPAMPHSITHKVMVAYS
jgi:hypothetical protein